MKKLFLSILLLCLTLSVFAQKNTSRVIIPESNLRFVANDDYTEVTITGFINDKKFAGKVIEIPSKIQGVPVTAIGTGAFQYNGSGISGIYIPDGINWIGPLAFNGSGFNSIRLPEGLEVIKYNTFTSCSAKTINIPASVKSIESGAFAGSQIESVTIPKDCRMGSVGESGMHGDVFRNSAIKTLIFPKGRIYFYKDTWRDRGTAFADCDNLENLVTPDELEVLMFQDDEDYYPDKNYTLADFVSGKKIDASFALQKQLKSIKVRDAMDVISSDKYLNNYKAAFDSGDFEKAMEISKEFQNKYSYKNDEWAERYNMAYEKIWINDYDQAFGIGDYVAAMKISNEFREKSGHYKDKEWDNRYALAASTYEKKYLDDYNKAFTSGNYETAMKISNEFRENSDHYNDKEWKNRYSLALSAYERKCLDYYNKNVEKNWGDAEKMAKEFLDEISWTIIKTNDYELKNELKDLKKKWEELLHLPLLADELLKSGFFEKDDSGTRFIIILSRKYYDGTSLFFVDSDGGKNQIEADEMLKRLNKKTGKDFKVGYGVIKDKSKKTSVEHYFYFSTTAKEAAEFEKKLEEDKIAKERAEQQKKYEQAFLNGTLHTTLSCNINGKWSCAVNFAEKDGIVSIDGFKVKKSIFEKKGLKPKDVIKQIVIKNNEENEVELNWKDLIPVKAIRAPATLIFTVERGSGKKAQTLTISVPVEWNADEIKKLR